MRLAIAPSMSLTVVVTADHRADLERVWRRLLDISDERKPDGFPFGLNRYIRPTYEFEVTARRDAAPDVVGPWSITLEWDPRDEELEAIAAEMKTWVTE